MTFDYSLAFMLPFARAAIRNTSNFSIPQFADLLFGELEKANVPGVERAPRTSPNRYNFTPSCPPALQNGTIEVMLYLEHHGFILPEIANFPGLNRFRYTKTLRGTEWANGAEPLPEDVNGYIQHLFSLVPSLDPIIRQYVEEGLGSFHRGMFFSAAVMLGAASEKEIYLLGDSLIGALKSSTEQKDLTELVSGRGLYKLLAFIGERVEKYKSARGVFDGAESHLMSLFESIRVQRNDAVHPKTATVNEESVRLSYNAFPRAVKKAEELRDWFHSNPQSV